MKVSLIVLTPGKWEKKAIPIAVAEFAIGRDATCQLRPASQVISNRHCAVLLRDGKVFVRDYESTNGTLVNNQRVVGDRLLQNGDCLQVGPLLFGVRIEATTPVNEPTPLTLPKMAPKSPDEDAAAALLMSVPDEGGPKPEGAEVDSTGVPTGSTVLMPAVDLLAAGKPGAEPAKAAKDAKGAKPPAVSTSVAAKAILEKYMRRPRA